MMLLRLFLSPLYVGDIPSFRDDEYRLALLIQNRFKRKVDCPDFTVPIEHVLFITHLFSLRGIPDRVFQPILDFSRVSPPIGIPEWASHNILFLESAKIQRRLIGVE